KTGAGPPPGPPEAEAPGLGHCQCSGDRAYLGYYIQVSTIVRGARSWRVRHPHPAFSPEGERLLQRQRRRVDAAVRGRSYPVTRPGRRAGEAARPDPGRLGPNHPGRLRVTLRHIVGPMRSLTMRSTFACLLFVTVFGLTGPTARADFVFTYGDHTYLVVTTPTPWVSAAEAARALSVGGQPGYLAHIEDAAENAAITAQLLAGIPAAEFPLTRAPDGGN